MHFPAAYPISSILETPSGMPSNCTIKRADKQMNKQLPIRSRVAPTGTRKLEIRESTCSFTSRILSISGMPMALPSKRKKLKLVCGLLLWRISKHIAGLSYKQLICFEFNLKKKRFMIYMCRTWHMIKQLKMWTLHACAIYYLDMANHIL